MSDVVANLLGQNSAANKVTDRVKQEIAKRSGDDN
jgi:hypothetical protein